MLPKRPHCGPLPTLNDGYSDHAIPPLSSWAPTALARHPHLLHLCHTLEKHDRGQAAVAIERDLEGKKVALGRGKS